MSANYCKSEVCRRGRGRGSGGGSGRGGRGSGGESLGGPGRGGGVDFMDLFERAAPVPLAAPGNNGGEEASHFDVGQAMQEPGDDAIIEELAAALGLPSHVVANSVPDVPQAFPGFDALRLEHLVPDHFLAEVQAVVEEGCAPRVWV